MAAGWKNPKAPYDFTQGMWEDYNKNYSNLSWEEYLQLTKWGIKNLVDKTPDKPEQKNKKYSFTEAYNKPIEEATDPVHYHFDIEPFDYIHDNQMGFAEGNVIKYITRWRYKENGIEDLYKAKQYIDMLIAKELIDDNTTK